MGRGGKPHKDVVGRQHTRQEQQPCDASSEPGDEDARRHSARSVYSSAAASTPLVERNTQTLSSDKSYKPVVENNASDNGTTRGNAGRATRASLTTGSRCHVEENIFLFVPNVLGYTRAILALAALAVAFRYVWILCICYCVSQLLDAADGYFARRYDQATLFGAVLDQVTDRLSTVGILILDSIVHSKYYYLFALVLIFDLGGHWIHTFASVCAGNETHKKIPETWPLLKLYYERKSLMFICHASNEFVWLALFVLTQVSSEAHVVQIIHWCLIPTVVFCILKNVTNLAQMIYGTQVLASIDQMHRSRRRAEN